MRSLLLIDDDSGVRELYSHWHETTEEQFRGRLGLQTAPDLATADECIAKTEYDAIIVDLNIPPGGQKGTLEWIKEKSKLPKFPPIIGLSGSHDVKLRQKVLACGAAQFFLKDDAQYSPSSFFKIVYNEFLKWFYASQEDTDSTDIRERESTSLS